jgi:MFS family permease
VPSSPSSFLGPAIAGYCGLLIGVGLSRFGFAPLIPAMVEAGWGPASGYHIAGAFNLAGYLLGAIIAVPLARHIGARATLAIAAVGGSLAFAGSAVDGPLWVFAGLRLVSGMIGGLLMIVLPPIIQAAVEPRFKGRVSGIAFAGVGTGFLLSGTALPLIAGLGPAPAWLGLALVMAVAGGVLMLTLPQAPAPTPDAQPAPAARLTAAPFIGLGFAYCGAAVSYVPHTLMFVDYVARDLGHGLENGGLVWTAMGVMAVASPLIAGAVADRIGFAAALRVVVGLMGVGALMPLVSGALPWLTISGMLGGGLMIGLGSLAAGRTREIVGTAAHPKGWAVQTIAFALCQAAGAYALAGLLAATGHYEVVFAVAGTTALTSIVIEMLLARHTARSA